MKILIYGLNYYPEPTATGKYTGEMAAWLAAQGHEVDAIASFPHYPSWEISEDYAGKGFHQEVLQGVKVHRTPLFVPKKEEVGAKNRIKMEMSYTLNSLRHWLPIFFQQRRYDAVIAVSPPMQIACLPMLYQRLRNVPWIFHIQDLQVDAAVNLKMIQHPLFIKLLFAVENYLLKQATVVSTITEAMRQKIIDKKIPEEKTIVFPNWTDINFITPLPKAGNTYREELGITANDVLFVYAGNVGEKQGLELLLEAAWHLKEIPNLQFVIAGEGSGKSRLMKVAAREQLGNVHFLPVQPLEKLPELLAAADVHLIIQKAGAGDIVMPSKLTNILAAGRPVIATAEPGTALYEVIEGHDLGKAGRPEEVGDLISNMLQLSNAPQERREMSKRARIYAETYLEKNSVLQKFEQELGTLTHKQLQYLQNPAFTKQDL